MIFSCCVSCVYVSISSIACADAEPSITSPCGIHQHMHASFQMTTIGG